MREKNKTQQLLKHHDEFLRTFHCAYEVICALFESVPENILQMALFWRRAEQTSKIHGGRSCMYFSRSSKIEEL